MLHIRVYKDTPWYISKLSRSCTLTWITTSLHQSQWSPKQREAYCGISTNNATVRYTSPWKSM